MHDTVFIAQGSDPFRAAKKALGFFGFSAENKRVLIKPNLTVAAKPESGLTTSHAVVKAVLERLNDCSVLIGDGGFETEKAFDLGGWRELAAEFNAKLVDLNKDRVVWKRIPRPIVSNEMPFAETALNTGLLINVAKLKVHAVAGVTLCLKNLFGVVPTREHRLRYHDRIRMAVLDINQVVRSDFCLIDGVIGNELHEVESHPVDSGIVLASRNPLAIDLVGCLCMCVDPESIETFPLAMELFGVPSIELKGAKLEHIARPYRLPNATSRPRALAKHAIARLFKTLKSG